MTPGAAAKGISRLPRLSALSLLALLAVACSGGESGGDSSAAGAPLGGVDGLVGAGAAVDVSANQGFVSLSVDAACGFRGDGSTACWFGGADRTERIGQSDWTMIDGRWDSGGCGIWSDGRLLCWPNPHRELPSPLREQLPFGDQRFETLSGGEYACAIGVDGSLACAGYGYGFPSWAIPEGEFVAVSAGYPYMCAIRAGGELACWNHPYDDPSPVLSPPEGEFTSVSVAVRYGCAVRVGGALACWNDLIPDYDYGQSSPPAGSFRSVAASSALACGLRVDGEIVCWGELFGGAESGDAGSSTEGGDWPVGPFTALDVSRRGEVCALRPSGEIVCWNNGSGTHRPPGGAFVAIDAGPTATCGVRPDGDIACWGFDLDRRTWEFVYPLDWRPPAGPFTAVSVGDGYACGLRPDGEAECWGRGHLRNPREIGEPVAQREIRARLEPPPGPFTALSADDQFTCGLRRDGELQCWGMTNTDSETPLGKPPSGPFSAVRAGHLMACGLRPDGSAACWDSVYGRTYLPGDGLPMPDGVFAALPTGAAQPCGLRPGGDLACTDTDAVAARNAPETAFRTVASNPRTAHNCGLDYAGEITCWYERDDWHEPTPPGPFTTVTVGNFHSCALRPDGTAECWTPHWPPYADPAPTRPCWAPSSTAPSARKRRDALRLPRARICSP